ncbi:hypothetical protein SmJEL517_g00650 [Synchytrium microbalum]|uniref:Palmitoyltransferase n=1 Tax=Synchytrium microbalum TaxID=1806994 RepID=A0A507CIT3_9FUNG|nr:uncharacterized protein SmJEL517_g00650 [Synchytrium microbalum]TPX37593.1 hypothetical protein SmJEL517_g00650 [Synchytrium microbalum]
MNRSADGPWPMKNKVLILLGFHRRDQFIFIMAVILLIVPNALFGVYIAPWAWSHTSPASVIIWAFLWLWTAVSHFTTTILEPGYLPKNLDPPADSNLVPTSRQPSLQPGQLPPNYPFNGGEFVPDTRSVVVNGWEVKIKYCHTCRSWRTPRCSHCSTCGRCVEGFDHHCPYVGTCLGKRNYRFFYMFLISVLCLSAYVLSFSLAMLIINGQTLPGGFWDAVAKYPVNAAIAIFGAMILISLSSLTTYHTMLIMQNMTTHDQLRERDHKFRASNITAPFDQGSVANNCCRVGNYQPLVLAASSSQSDIEAIPPSSQPPNNNVIIPQPVPSSGFPQMETRRHENPLPPLPVIDHEAADLGIPRESLTDASTNAPSSNATSSHDALIG